VVGGLTPRRFNLYSTWGQVARPDGGGGDAVRGRNFLSVQGSLYVLLCPYRLYVLSVQFC